MVRLFLLIVVLGPESDTTSATYFTFMSIMCLGFLPALTIPRPQQVIRNDGSHVAAHKFQSLREEFAGLKRTLTSTSFLFLLPYFLYCVCISPTLTTKEGYPKGYADPCCSNGILPTCGPGMPPTTVSGLVDFFPRSSISVSAFI